MNRSLQDYFAQFKSQSELTLVGPLCEKEGSWVEPIVFVDGGAKFKKNGSGFSVGDNDSHQNKLDELLPTQKDESDLAYVLRKIPSHFKTISLIGFLGGRKDHELINFFECHRFLKTKSSCNMNFENQVEAYAAGSYETQVRGIFSVITFEQIDLEIQGQCEYQITKKQIFLPLSSHGLSNMGHGKITIYSSGPFFVFKEVKTR